MSDQFLDLVTATVADQLVGFPIGDVHDVFVLGAVTPVPLAGRAVLGLANLRGRIVTVVDLRARLGLPPAGPGRRMAVGIARDGDAYGLVVDAVGEVLRLGPEGRADALAPRAGPFAPVSAGLHRLPSRLLVVLDVGRCLDLPSTQALAA